MCDDLQHSGSSGGSETSTHRADRDDGTRTRSANSAGLDRAVAYIEAHHGQRCSLDTLASVAGLSRFHFARQFRRATGYSPMEYVARQRVECGKRMLANGNTSVCELALSLGFYDQSHFSRVFRRITGSSPRAYARSHSAAASRDR